MGVSDSTGQSDDLATSKFKFSDKFSEVSLSTIPKDRISGSLSRFKRDGVDLKIQNVCSQCDTLLNLPKVSILDFSKLINNSSNSPCFTSLPSDFEKLSNPMIYLFVSRISH